MAGDHQVKTSLFVNTDPKRGVLNIRQIEAGDAGDYMCVAMNLAGSAQGTIKLDVGCKLIPCKATFSLLLYYVHQIHRCLHCSCVARWSRGIFC